MVKPNGTLDVRTNARVFASYRSSVVCTLEPFFEQTWKPDDVVKVG